MDARPKSKHKVLLFDPTRDAGAVERGLSCQPIGLVRVPSGAYWVCRDGTGGGPINGQPCEVWFEKKDGSVVEAWFTLTEIEPLLTGAEAALDEHVAPGHESQFWHWQRKFDKAVGGGK